MILDIKIKPSSDPYMLLRKAGYDINFQTINLDKLLDKDTLYMNVKLYPEIGSGCQYKQECVGKMAWNDECCQCTCENPDVNMYYKEYEGKLIEICAKRTCEDNEIMQFKQYLDGSYYQECVPNPLQKKISGQLTKDDILVEVSNYWYLLVAVLMGGQLGNFLNLKIFPTRTLAMVTALLVIFVAVRMGIRTFL